jgi:hypothetical protein
MSITASSVTIAFIRAHGVTNLLVYCQGKREGDWPCHHRGTLSMDGFKDCEALSEIGRRCRCTACGWRRAEIRPDYSVKQDFISSRDALTWALFMRPGKTSLLRHKLTSEVIRL